MDNYRFVDNNYHIEIRQPPQMDHGDIHFIPMDLKGTLYTYVSKQACSAKKLINSKKFRSPKDPLI